MLAPLRCPLHGIVRSIDRPVQEERAIAIGSMNSLPSLTIRSRKKSSVAKDLLAISPKVVSIGTIPVKEVRVIVDAPAHVAER